MYSFRESTLGLCLKDAVDEMTQTGKISEHLSEKILQQFDKVCWTKFSPLIQFFTFIVVHH